MTNKPYYFLVCVIFPSLVLQTLAQKKATIKVTNMEKCATNSSNPIPWTFELKNANTEGYKKLDLEIDMTSNTFDKETMYTLDVDKYSNGDWDKNVYNADGGLCDLINEYIPKAWQKMMNQITPKPTGICGAQQAVYKLKDFDVLKSDLQIPPLYGICEATLRVFDTDDNDILCAVLRVEITDE